MYVRIYFVRSVCVCFIFLYVIELRLCGDFSVCYALVLIIVFVFLTTFLTCQQ